MRGIRSIYLFSSWISFFFSLQTNFFLFSCFIFLQFYDFFFPFTIFSLQEENDPNFKGCLWSDLLTWYLNEFEYELSNVEIFDAKKKTVNQVTLLFYFVFHKSHFVFVLCLFCYFLILFIKQIADNRFFNLIADKKLLFAVTSEIEFQFILCVK